MTTATTQASSAAPTTPRAPSVPSPLLRTLRYAAHATRMTVTNVFFMVFTIAMPVGMYLLFGMMLGDLDEGQVRTMVMVNMAAYGGLGAAVSAGTQVLEDQRSGFLRQLIVAGMSPRSFLAGSVIAASAVIVPALLAVCLVGVLTGVDVGPGQLLATVGVLWLALLPTILIGLALGSVLTGGAATAGGVVTMMLMAILGGLWMPLEMFPAWMQSLGSGLPTYWVARLGEWTTQGGPMPVTGLLVIGAWTAVLGAICMLGMSRAVGLSRR